MTRPFKVLGIQQIAIGGLDKQRLGRLWIDMLGLQLAGNFRSERDCDPNACPDNTGNRDGFVGIIAIANCFAGSGLERLAGSAGKHQSINEGCLCRRERERPESGPFQQSR